MKALLLLCMALLLACSAAAQSAGDNTTAAPSSPTISYIDADYLYNFPSMFSIIMVLNQRLSAFDVDSFKTTLKTYLNVTEANRTQLLAQFVLLEVCSCDIGNGSSVLKDEHAYYLWSKQVCGRYADGINTGQDSSSWAGTLVRFSFMSVTSVAGRVAKNGIRQFTDLNNLQVDVQYLSAIIDWPALIGTGLVVASNEDSTPPSAAAAGFESLAFKPTIGQMSGRPLATVGPWGQYIDSTDKTIRQTIEDNVGAVVAAIVIIIVLVIMGCCACWCVYRYRQKQTQLKEGDTGVRRARRSRGDRNNDGREFSDLNRARGPSPASVVLQNTVGQTVPTSDLNPGTRLASGAGQSVADQAQARANALLSAGSGGSPVVASGPEVLESGQITPTAAYY